MHISFWKAPHAFENRNAQSFILRRNSYEADYVDPLVTGFVIDLMARDRVRRVAANPSLERCLYAAEGEESADLGLFISEHLIHITGKETALPLG